MAKSRRKPPYWRRINPAAQFDITILRHKSLPRGKRFETRRDANEESGRSAALLATRGQGKSYGVILQECRDGNYHCEKTYCPLCAREFRRYFAGELLRLTAKFKGIVKIVTILLEAVPNGKLGNVEISRYHHVLRKRLKRAGLDDVTIIGGFEVVYRAQEKIWVLHINLAFFGGKPDAIAAFENSFVNSTIDRPVMTLDVKDPVEQLSYLLKFTTYHRPFKQTGPTKSPAKPLNPADHCELVDWMAQHDFADHLFLFNARRYGASIQFRNASARKA